MPRIWQLSKKISLPHLELMIRNKSVLLSLFSQERLLWSSHETDAIAALEMTTVIVFNSDVPLWGWCPCVKSSGWSPGMSALPLFSRNPPQNGEKMVKSWKLLLYPKTGYGLVSVWYNLNGKYCVLLMMNVKQLVFKVRWRLPVILTYSLLLLF